MDDEIEYMGKTDEREKYLADLKEIIIKSNPSFVEGNCFYQHCTLNLIHEFYSKQLNLYWAGKQATQSICEIGFNAGHSAMLMLLGRNKTPLNFTVFDIGGHPYTRPCFNYIQTSFPHVQFEYVEGDSTVTMPEWIKRNSMKYDVVHVDGGHTDHCIARDMKHTDLIVKTNGIVIIDDTNFASINKFVDFYLSSGRYVELTVRNTDVCPHRVIKKIKD